MKFLRLCSLGLFLSFPTAAFAGVIFTTVFLDDEGVVYVGLKHGEGKGESQVIAFPFNFNSAGRTNIPLPEEISHRDVIGLLTEKKKLFVLTNSTGEKGDGPMLHVFDRKKSQWRKVGKVECPSFTKVNLKPTQMVFFCEYGKMKHGKSQITPRTLSFGKERIYRTGTWRFPESYLLYKGHWVILEGRAPTWDRLRLRSEGGDRTISAEDLFQLPIPAPLPEATPPDTKENAES